MKKTKRKPTQHISVTLDFLRTIPGFNIKEENQLRAALYAIGFQVSDADGLPKRITMLHNKNVRCANFPSTYRKTTIFVGDMRNDYPYAGIYNGIDILDVEMYSEKDMEFVIDLPYDLPVAEKVNVRKYTKRVERKQSLDISFDSKDESWLGDVFGLGD